MEVERAEKTKERRCIIVGAGDFFGLPFPLRNDDLLIAADGGYVHLKAAGIRPQLVVGDFDSMHIPGVKGETGAVSGLSIFADAEKADYIHHLESRTYDGVETLVIDPVKNDPDLLACIRIGMEAGCREFHLLGGTGGDRIDHSIANFQLLGFLARRGLHGYLYSAHQVVTAICNEAACFPAEQRGYFSALALSDTAEGVTERGFKYVVEDVTLNNCTPTGLSNEFVGAPADISVRNGVLLLIYEYEASVKH